LPLKSTSLFLSFLSFVVVFPFHTVHFFLPLSSNPALVLPLHPQPLSPILYNQLLTQPTNNNKTPGDELASEEIRRDMCIFVGVVQGLAFLCGLGTLLTSDRGFYRLLTVLEISVTATVNLQQPVLAMRGFASIVFATGLLTSFFAYKTSERIQEEGNEEEERARVHLTLGELFVSLFIFVHFFFVFERVQCSEKGSEHISGGGKRLLFLFFSFRPFSFRKTPHTTPLSHT
jgi:hypothetical protein